MRSPATSRAELVDLLSCARAALRDAADPDPERSLDGATAFMDALVALGQTLALHPAWSRAEVRDFVRETAPHLAPAAYGFSRWVSSALALLEDVWEMSPEVETRTVDTHVKRLREKLGSGRDLLETVRGVGYRLVDPSEQGQG